MKIFHQDLRGIKKKFHFIDSFFLHKLAIPISSVIIAYLLYPFARFAMPIPIAIFESLFFGLVFSWWFIGTLQYGWRFVMEKTIIWTVAAVKYCVYIPLEWLVVHTIQLLKLPFRLIMNSGKHLPKIFFPFQLLFSICYAAALIYGICFGIDLFFGGKQEHWFHWVIFGLPYGLPLYAVVFIVAMVVVGAFLMLIDHIMDVHIMPRFLKFAEKEVKNKRK